MVEGNLRLAIISKPIAKIYTLDHNTCPFVAFDKSNGLEHVFNLNND